MAPGKAGFCNLESRIAEAVTKGAANWFSKISGGKKGIEAMCDNDSLENLIRVSQALMGDLKIFEKMYHKIFERTW